MKKAVLIIICLVLLTIPISGCVSVNIGGGGWGSGVSGRGALETFTFDVGEITEIRVNTLSNIEHYTTHSDTVTLEIQPNLMQYITVVESNGILQVRATRNINWSGGNTPVLTVGAPNLNRVNLTGAGTFTAHDTITVDTFNIDFAGAGTGRANLDVSNVTVNVAGAADFTLTGNAEKADFILAGAGRIEALGLQTETANVNLSGAGTVRVSSSDSLSVNAAGVGTVEYRGSPKLDISRGGLVTVRSVD